MTHWSCLQILKGLKTCSVLFQLGEIRSSWWKLQAHRFLLKSPISSTCLYWEQLLGSHAGVRHCMAPCCGRVSEIPACMRGGTDDLKVPSYPRRMRPREAEGRASPLVTHNRHSSRAEIIRGLETALIFFFHISKKILEPTKINK